MKILLTNKELDKNIRGLQESLRGILQYPWKSKRWEESLDRITDQIMILNNEKENRNRKG
jgi:hypothetical protein